MFNWYAQFDGMEQRQLLNPTPITHEIGHLLTYAKNHAG